VRALLTGLMLASLAAAADAQTKPTRGTWAGDVYQDGIDAPYQVTITLTGETGTVAYRGSAQCRGVLTALRYANGRPYEGMYQERITENAYDPRRPRPNACITGGTVSVTRTPGGQLSFRWSIPSGDDQMRAGGELDPQ
jgi:hypothetical protein